MIQFGTPASFVVIPIALLAISVIFLFIYGGSFIVKQQQAVDLGNETVKLGVKNNELINGTYLAILQQNIARDAKNYQDEAFKNQSMIEELGRQKQAYDIVHDVNETLTDYIHQWQIVANKSQQERDELNKDFNNGLKVVIYKISNVTAKISNVTEEISDNLNKYGKGNRGVTEYNHKLLSNLTNEVKEIKSIVFSLNKTWNNYTKFEYS